MIKLKITSTPDDISHGDYQFSLHHVTIGKGMKCSIIVNDPRLEREQATFRLTSRGLILESKHPFTHNRKKVSGTIILNKGDQVLLGQTELTITDFDNSNLLSSDSYYNRINDLSNKPHIIKLISAIEEEFVYQTEKEINALEEDV